MRKILTLTVLLIATSSFAQSTGKSFPIETNNELGIRYSAHLYMGNQSDPDLQAFSIDYAHYNFQNIGFRTGLQIFIDGDIEDYYSVPMLFTWRSNRIRNFGVAPDGYSVGSYFTAFITSFIPKQIELHSGITPGFLFGAREEPSAYNYRIRHRFACTFDLGARLIIPIWRFNLYGDFTYHCYLTDNFERASQRPLRSFMEMGIGLSFQF